MKLKHSKDVVPGAIAVLLLAASCGGSSSTSSGDYDPGCQPASGNSLNASCDPGFTQSTPSANSIEVTFSGETLGQVGLPFKPVNSGDPVFVDGWNVTFTEILTVLGNFHVSPGATQYLTWNQLNPDAATRKGPYVVDMHKPSGFTGADGVEPAQALFRWTKQDNGEPFDTSQLYAFSYDTMKAQYPVAQVNLTPDQKADYDLMVSKGWSKLYRGQATYVGTETTAPHQDLFNNFPTTIYFIMGWNDATHYINCINPNNGNGEEDNLANRGLQTNTNNATVAQVTQHVDHVFWDKLRQEGANLRFDPYAAWAPANTSPTNPFDMTTLHHPLSALFNDGVTPIPDRTPLQNPPTGSYTPGEGASNGNIAFDTNGVPAANVPDIIDFMAFSAQSQMHLNANGLCYVVGQNASDPFFNPSVP